MSRLLALLLWLAATKEAASRGTAPSNYAFEEVLFVDSACEETERPSFIQQDSRLARLGDFRELPASALEVLSTEETATVLNSSANLSSNASAEVPRILVAAPKGASLSGAAAQVAQTQAEAVAQAESQALTAAGDPDVDVVVVTVPQFEHTKRTSAAVAAAAEQPMGVSIAGEGGEPTAEGSEEVAEEFAAEKNMERYKEREEAKTGSAVGMSSRPPRVWLLLFLLLALLVCGCGIWQGIKFWRSKGAPTPSVPSRQTLISHSTSFSNITAAQVFPPAPISVHAPHTSETRSEKVERYAIHTARTEVREREEVLPPPPMPPPPLASRALSIRSLKGVPLLMNEASVFDLYRGDKPALQALIVHQPHISTEAGAWRHGVPIVTLRSIADPSAGGHEASYIVLARCRAGGFVDGRRSMYIFDTREELIGIIEKASHNNVYYLRNEKLQQELSFKGHFIEDVVVADQREGPVATTQPASTPPRLSNGEYVGGSWYTVEPTGNVVEGSTMELLLLCGLISIDYDEAHPASG